MDYSQLPEELIEKIATDHLEAYSQFIAFSGVCKSWRSAAFRLHPSRRPRLPGLLVPKCTDSQSLYSNGGPIHDFYPLTTLCPSTPPPSPPPTPRATLSLLPSPSKISDAAVGHRKHYLHRYHNLSETADHNAIKNPEYSNDDDHESSSRVVSRSSYYELTDRCLGSKDGWILRSLPRRSPAFLHHRVPQHLYLVNPITGASVPLPAHPDYSVTYGSRICKAIISSSPDDDDDNENEECHVFIVCQEEPQLAWCQVSPPSRGGQCWKFVGADWDSRIFRSPQDATYFGGKLYVAEPDRVLVLDHDLLKKMMTSSSAVRPTPTPTPTPPPTVIMRSFPFSEAMMAPYRWEWQYHIHLCHINGQLHVIIHRFEGGSVSFRVFKLLQVLPTDNTSATSTCTSYYWKEVRSLDGHAVFLGPHESFSIDASATTRDGVRGDHIYSVMDKFCWNGAFNLVNRNVETFARCSWRCPYFWFLPMTWDISKLHNKDDAKKKKKKAGKREHLLQTTANKHDDCNSNVTLPGSESWRLPKKTIKNHHLLHCHHDNSNSLASSNKFQALSSSEEEDEVGED